MLYSKKLMWRDEGKYVPPEKSSVKFKEAFEENNPIDYPIENSNENHEENHEYQPESNTMQQMSEMNTLSNSVFTNMSNNKREETYNKMAERELVSQVSLNPFLQDQTPYEDVVTIRDKFLMPYYEKKPNTNKNVEEYKS
tara:strand:+ start:2496 stop:2915 length:420 start_codon:yes stop_codon:yes gene_type:complete